MKTKDTSHHYLNEKIKRENLSPDPIDQFMKWFQDAEATHCIEVNAMTLTTATKDGKPSCRTVLLKSIGSTGLIFYTNYQSRKGRELTENPHGSVLFFWRELMRQVIVEGRVESLVVKNRMLTSKRGQEGVSWEHGPPSKTVSFRPVNISKVNSRNMKRNIKTRKCLLQTIGEALGSCRSVLNFGKACKTVFTIDFSIHSQKMIRGLLKD